MAKKQKNTLSEIYDGLYSAKKELFTLKLQKATGQLSKTHLMRMQKREFARLMTLLQQAKGKKG